MGERPPAPERAVSAGNPWAGVMMPVPGELSGQPTSPATPVPVKRREIPLQTVELSVAIDKSILSALELPERLEPLRETYLALPERLDFAHGPSLFFGPNGSGKTTLARAIFYALEVAERYQFSLERSGDEEKAREYADSALEIPETRSTDYENFLAAGAAPLIARALKLERYQNNTYPRYCDTQEEVGRKAQLRREMARQSGMREVQGGHFEFRGDRYSTADLLAQRADDLSARQTVDETIGQYLKAAFSPGHLVASQSGDWRVPEEFASKQPRFSDKELGFEPDRIERAQPYAPGIAFIDEPETGLDPRRHMALPEDLEAWYPDGSILVIPSNSTELFRSPLPRLDLGEPEKGIHTPDSR